MSSRMVPWVRVCEAVTPVPFANINVSDPRRNVVDAKVAVGSPVCNGNSVEISSSVTLVKQPALS